MLMNPLYFAVFTLAAFAAYSFTPPRYRPVCLLASSLIFFALLLEPAVWPVLALMVLGTHIVAMRLDSASGDAPRRRWLVLGILGNLSVLVLFKYLGFLTGCLNSCLHGLNLSVTLSAPHWPAFIGVSYLVFQAISYLLDIHFKTIKREPSLFFWSLHLCLFPKGIQGPIERAGDLIPQLKETRSFDYENFRAGLLQLAWGLFKKAVIADRLAYLLDPVFADVNVHSGPVLLLATYGFALELFCDFSGYTDMALGAARLFNLRLTQNFNAPFLATGMQDFWKRWHISLSNWILDYVFQPLQMAFRKLGGVPASALALFIAFLAIGVWHGASWGFVVFGLIQGTYMTAAFFYRPYQKRLYRFLGLEKKPWLKIWQIFITFNLVCFSFIFFKASSLTDAGCLITHIFRGWSRMPALLACMKDWVAPAHEASKLPDLIILAASLASILAVFLVKTRIRFYQQPTWFRWAVYYLQIFALFFFGMFFAQKQFIYSQF